MNRGRLLVLTSIVALAAPASASMSSPVYDDTNGLRVESIYDNQYGVVCYVMTFRPGFKSELSAGISCVPVGRTRSSR